MGTEVLFSLAGFNGEVYKQLAEDLFAQIKSANLNGTKIFLRYFSDVRKEMDSFFNGAKMIIEKNTVSFDTVAMKAILNSCEAPSDVDVKKQLHILLFFSRKNSIVAFLCIFVQL